MYSVKKLKNYSRDIRLNLNFNNSNPFSDLNYTKYIILIHPSTFLARDPVVYAVYSSNSFVRPIPINPIIKNAVYSRIDACNETNVYNMT